MAKKLHQINECDAFFKLQIPDNPLSFSNMGMMTKTVPEKETINRLLKIDPDMTLMMIITGYGGTWLERNIPDTEKTFKLLENLIINSGLKRSKIIIVVDPVIPTPMGIERAMAVIDKAVKNGYRCFAYEFFRSNEKREAKYKEVGAPVPTDIKEANPKVVADFRSFLAKEKQLGADFITVLDDREVAIPEEYRKKFNLDMPNPQAETETVKKEKTPPPVCDKNCVLCSRPDR